jgi:HSP20 family protein
LKTVTKEGADTMAQSTLEKRNPQEVVQAETEAMGRAYSPTVDILDRKDEILVLSDMPGVKGGDVDIRFENGELSIHGKVNARQSEGTRYLVQEYGTGYYYRTFEISEAIDTERISAEYKDGVLKLVLPKVEAVKPRKIAVKTN